MLGWTVLHSEQAGHQIGQVHKVSRGPFFNEHQASDPDLNARIRECGTCIPLAFTFSEQPLTAQLKEKILAILKKAIADYVAKLKQFFAKPKLNKKEVDDFVAKMIQDNGSLESLLNFFYRYDFHEPALELIPLVEQLEEVLERQSQDQIKMSAKTVSLLKMLLSSHYKHNGFAHIFLKNTMMARSYLDNALNELEEMLPEAKKLPFYFESKAFIYNYLFKGELEANNLLWASKILESACKNNPNSSECVSNSVLLSQAWEKKGDFRNAYYWRKKALEYYKTVRVTNHFYPELDAFKANRPEHEQKKEALLEKHFSDLHQLLTQYGIVFSIDKKNDQLTLSASLPKILSSIHNVISRSSFSIQMELLDNKLVIKPYSLLGKNEAKHLLNILRAYKEREAALRAELEAQRQKMAELNITQTSVSQITTPALPEPGAAINKPIASLALEPPAGLPKPKAALLPSFQNVQRRQEELRNIAEPPLSDALKLGFSEEVFGNAKFYQCRSRGENRPYYVVFKGAEGKELPPQEVMDDFVKNRIPNAKIVPAFGEQGFKWLQYNKPVKGMKPLPVLYCKNNSEWRLFPTAFQSNKKGEMAFLYGEFHHTKNGLWDKQLRDFGVHMKKVKNICP